MIEERKALFESLGGLPETSVRNTEWLYMLEEDTRQSLAIEGYFRTKDQLAAVLHGGKSDLAISNYFRTAQDAYDLALQYYVEKAPPPLSLAEVRHFHSELFRELDDHRGRFRPGGVKIAGAKITPPELDAPAYLQAALELASVAMRTQPTLRTLARVHTLFESIHPFYDGNGRVGRILLNYLAIGAGYPPIVIKGSNSEERSRYYSALEAGDRGFRKGFPDPTPEALGARLDEGDVGPLCQLLSEGVLPRLDRMIALAMETQTGQPLQNLPQVAAQLGITEGALRVRIHRGRHIAIKLGTKVVSHPRLALP